MTSSDTWGDVAYRWHVVNRALDQQKDTLWGAINLRNIHQGSPRVCKSRMMLMFDRMYHILSHLITSYQELASDELEVFIIPKSHVDPPKRAFQLSTIDFPFNPFYSLVHPIIPFQFSFPSFFPILFHGIESGGLGGRVSAYHLSSWCWDMINNSSILFIKIILVNGPFSSIFQVLFRFPLSKNHDWFPSPAVSHRSNPALVQASPGRTLQSYRSCWISRGASLASARTWPCDL